MDKINLSGIPRCNQIWEGMQPMEGGRLCAKCNKCIVDFREKSYLEIAIIRASSPEPVCGIYTEEQLTFDITKPRLKKKNPFRQAFAFSATLLSMLAKISAQDSAEKVFFTEKLVLLEKQYNSHAPQEIKQTKIENKVDTIIFKGKIMDALDSTALIGASVLVKGHEMGTATDMDGSFRLPLSSDFNEGKPVTFLFSNTGYATQEKEYQLDTLNNFSELIALQPSMQLIEFVVTSRDYQVHRWRLWFREFLRRFGL